MDDQTPERLVVTPNPDADLRPNRPARFVRRDAPVPCPACGRTVVRKARRQKFCSTRCKEKARQRTRKALLGRDTGAPANPPKLLNKINGLQGSKWRPRVGISAPAVVVDAELMAGRNWQPVTSSDGVRCLIAGAPR